MSGSNTEWVHNLYVKYAPLLHRIATHRINDGERAKDLVQDVFLSLLSKADKVKDHTEPGAWLIQALNYNIYHEYSRQSQKKATETNLDEALVLSEQPGPDTIDEILPKQLPDRDKQILKLYYEKRMSYAEIGAEMGINPSTCGTLLSRAKERCRKYVKVE